MRRNLKYAKLLENTMTTNNIKLKKPFGAHILKE